MVFLYIDESGDMGFNSKGSKYFIFTCVKINDDRTDILFRRIPKEIRQRTLKKKIKEQSELKFSNSSPLIREQFLTRVAKLDLEIYALIVDKSYTSQNLKNNLSILYNYLIKILLEGIITKNHKIEICLDKCMSKSQREQFESYIKTEFLYKFMEIPNLKISHEISYNNEGLQVVDFICGAFGYKYNTSKLMNDCNYYTDLIKTKIKIERNDFFKKR